jgi:very-short-patch-repair endonuclease
MAYNRHSNRQELRERRRERRKNATLGEKTLWSALRDHRRGIKFRREHSKGNFILDLYAPDIDLCIEIDGATHDSPEAQSYDQFRQCILESEGITVIRFKDADVLEDLENTLIRIDEKVKELKLKRGLR